MSERRSRDQHQHARADSCREHRTDRCHLRLAFLRLHLTITRLVVVRPAFGLVDLTLPLPRNLYLQSALLSFLRAFFTVSPRSFGTLHFFFADATGGGGGGGGRWRRHERRGAVRDPADVVADVLGEPQRAVGPGGDRRPARRPGAEVGNSFVSTPLGVIRPILPAPVSVNQSAPSEPGRDARTARPRPEWARRCRPVVMRRDLVRAELGEPERVRRSR